MALGGKVLVALVAGVLALAAQASTASSAAYWRYSYPKARDGLAAATVALSDATVEQGGHVAVWVGAEEKSRWLQAGVYVGYGEGHVAVEPHAYFEVCRPRCRFRDLGAASQLAVRLAHEGTRWRLYVGSQLVAAMTLRPYEWGAMAEDMHSPGHRNSFRYGWSRTSAAE
jgi:hypothetical protein